MLETKTVSLPVTLPRGFEECERCVNRLRDALLQIEGVTSVEVNAKNSTMTLVYDPHLAPIEEVQKRAGVIGVDLKEHYEHKTLDLAGLDCPDCALKLEKGVGRINGVLWVSTNFASSRMSVEYEPNKVNIPTISKRVQSMGYDVAETGRAEAHPGEAGHVHDHEHEHGHEHPEHGMRPVRWLPIRQTELTFTAGILLIIGLLMAALHLAIPSKVCFGLAALTAGLYAARGAVYSLLSLALDMNFLMTAAAIGAIAIGDWFEAAAVMFLFSLGNALEARTMERARESVRSLVSLFPTQGRVRRDGVDIEIPVNEVRVGDLCIVRPGEKIPTDGIVVEGTSTVNQASVTGESMPVEKLPGDKVYAGSINQRGSFDMTATATATDNTLAKVVHMVEEAQSEKAPSQRFAEVFGRYYTPVVTGLAVFVAIVPPLFTDVAFSRSLYMALTLLVVSCPCALVISTPVTIVSAIANAARNGVLVKGGSHLEAAGLIDVVAFDKTGTITTGESRVTDIIGVNGSDEARVLSLAASVESRSEHPLAEAIRREAKARNIEPLTVTDFQTLTGMGAAARFNGDTCIIGNSRLMEQLGVEIGEEESILRDLQSQGKTAVMVASNGTLRGIIALRDTVRESAKAAFEQLRNIGVKRIVMITGDNEAAARAVASDLGVDEYYAELLPQDKVDIVRVLIERFGSRVAFVGDGVNDAPALAASSVGIAMGAAGSDTALETADIALMSDDLTKLPYALRLSRTALSTVRQNVYFSLTVIGVLVLTAVLGWLKLSLGVFGHEGSALIVIANGMRLLRFK